MKIRNGFVSNSSSSSFIITGQTIEAIAIEMLDLVITDFSDWDDNTVSGKNKKKDRVEQFDVWESNLEKALRKKDVKNGKIGIVMPSCNYDTYIIGRADGIYVATSNNHTWDFDAPNLEYENGEIKWALDSDINDANYFDVRCGFIHSHEKWDDLRDGQMLPCCPKCKTTAYGYVVDTKGRKICSTCFKGVFGKTIEKEIEDIQKNKKKISLTDHMQVED